MALDPNLAMRVGQYGATQMPEYGNMLAQATNIQSARQTQQMNALKMQAEEMERRRAEEEGQIYTQAVGAEGYDPALAMRLAGERGQGRMVPALLEQQRKAADARRADEEAKLKKFDSDRKAIGMLMGGADSPEEFEFNRQFLEKNGVKVDKIPPYSPETRSMLNRWAQTPEQRSAEQKVVRFVKSADGTTFGVNEQGKPVVAYGPGLTPVSTTDGRMTDMQFAYQKWRAANPNAPEDDFYDVWATLARGPSEATLADRAAARESRENIDRAKLELSTRALEYRRQFNATADERARENLQMRGRQLDLTQRRLELDTETSSPEYKRLVSEAQETGKRIAANDVEALDKLPSAIDTARYTLSVLNDLVGDAEVRGGKLYVPPGGRAPAAGFSDAVGAGPPLARYIPGTAANSFAARTDQILGRGFLQAFETLRGAGHITQVEGEKGTAAIVRMKLSLSEDEFLIAAKEFKAIVQQGLENASKRLGTAQTRTGRSERQPAPQPAAAAPQPAPQPNVSRFTPEEINRDIATLEAAIAANPNSPEASKYRAVVESLKAGRR
jgi:hypothetical protein